MTADSREVLAVFPDPCTLGKGRAKEIQTVVHAAGAVQNQSGSENAFFGGGEIDRSVGDGLKLYGVLRVEDHGADRAGKFRGRHPVEYHVAYGDLAV